MKNFKDYSISKKLLTSFLGLTVIIILSGAAGILGISKVNKNDTYMHEVKTAPVYNLINAVESLYQIRIDARGAVIYTGITTQLALCEDSYIKNREIFLSESEVFRKSISSSESLEIIDEAINIFNTVYDPAIQNVFKYAKAGNQAAANSVEVSISNKLDTLFSDYEKLVENRMIEIKEISELNDRTTLITGCILLAFVALGAIASILLGIKISKMISNPINKIVDAADKLALGYVDVDLSGIDSKDETGQLAAAFLVMTEEIRKQVLVAESISNGDFTKEVPLRSDKDVLGLALNKIKKDLNETLFTISMTADQVNIGAEQVSSASQALASGAAEQAATVEELNATISAIAQQADNNVISVKKANDFVEQASNGVNESNLNMKKLSNAMNEISVASEKISSITRVIEDIAFQTNILALNAAIEAARAGNAGKGFAVVADEVRNLAAKSAEAAKQTTVLIQQSVNTVSEGDKLAAEVAKTLVGVTEKTKLVEESIHEIEAASTSQAKAIEEINQGMSQVSSIVQTNAATAEECSASSEELAAQSQALRQEVDKFTLLDDSGMEYEKDQIINQDYFDLEKHFHSDFEGGIDKY